jgi:pimeloyl-ACP methyl ester carboxylesterase
VQALALRDGRMLETMQRRRRASRGRTLLLLVLLAGVAIVSVTRLVASESPLVRSTFTVQGPVLEMRPAGGETSLVAVVAHGFAGSKELMSSFGVELARAGVTAYLFDFPGHSESSVAVPADTYRDPRGQINLRALGEVIDYVRAHNHASRLPHVILLGHSMGAAAVGEYAVAHPVPWLVATILVSPVGPEIPTASVPRNLLILSGQNDLSSVLQDSARLQALGCGVSQIPPTQCGDPAHGTGRRSVILSGLNHITILTASAALGETIRWLHTTTPGQVSASELDADQRLFWLLLAVVSLLLAFFPLSALLVDLWHISGPPDSINGQNVLFFALAALVGIVAAVAIQYVWQPFTFLHILLADYTGGYLCLSALVMALCIWLFRRTLPLPAWHQAGRQFCLALLLALILYLTVGQLSTFAWQRLALTPQRLWRMLCFFGLVWPICLLDEGICRGYQEYGVLRALAASVCFKVLLLAGLVASILLVPGLGFLSLLLPLLALVYVFLVALCTHIVSRRRAALTGATFCALVLAWMLATSFPLTS